MIEYKVIRNENRQSGYPWIIIKSYPGFFSSFYCTGKQVKTITNLEQLYKEARKNGKA